VRTIEVRCALAAAPERKAPLRAAPSRATDGVLLVYSQAKSLHVYSAIYNTDLLPVRAVVVP
jgi:hypothetical protein